MTYTWTDNAMQGGATCDVDKVNDNLMYLRYENTSVGRNFIDGLILSNNSSDNEHDIDISVGECIDSTNSIKINFDSILTKQIDANWQEGSNLGGFPSGLTLSTNTWYHVFVISKADGTVDAGFDSSLDASNLLDDATDYTYYRRIGSVLTDASSNIIQFVQTGDYFKWKTGNIYGVIIYGSTNVPTTGTDVTVSAPTGIKTRPILDYWCSNSSTRDVDLYILDKNTGAGHHSHIYDSVDRPTQAFDDIFTSTASQIQIYATHANTTTYIYTQGYIDSRGKE